MLNKIKENISKIENLENQLAAARQDLSAAIYPVVEAFCKSELNEDRLPFGYDEMENLSTELRGDYVICSWEYNRDVSYGYSVKIPNEYFCENYASLIEVASKELKKGKYSQYLQSLEDEIKERKENLEKVRKELQNL